MKSHSHNMLVVDRLPWEIRDMWITIIDVDE